MPTIDDLLAKIECLEMCVEQMSHHHMSSELVQRLLDNPELEKDLPKLRNMLKYIPALQNVSVEKLFVYCDEIEAFTLRDEAFVRELIPYIHTQLSVPTNYRTPLESERQRQQIRRHKEHCEEIFEALPIEDFRTLIRLHCKHTTQQRHSNGSSAAERTNHLSWVEEQLFRDKQYNECLILHAMYSPQHSMSSAAETMFEYIIEDLEKHPRSFDEISQVASQLTSLEHHAISTRVVTSFEQLKNLVQKAERTTPMIRI